MRKLNYQPAVPLFLYGFSAGGLVAMNLALDQPNLCDYLILEGPSIKFHEKACPPMLISLCVGLVQIPYVIRFIGKIKLAKDIERLAYTRNTVRRHIIAHDLDGNDHGGMSLKMGWSMIQVQQYVLENACKITEPVFIAIGESDNTVCPETTRKLAETTNADKIHVYKDAYHCLHEEMPETLREYLHDLKQWIREQLNKLS